MLRAVNSKNSIGLLYEPACKSDLLMLFGLLMLHLQEKFVIDQYRGSFPDRIAKRNGEEIEFEIHASIFFVHKNTPFISYPGVGIKNLFILGLPMLSNAHVGFCPLKFARRNYGILG